MTRLIRTMIIGILLLCSRSTYAQDICGSGGDRALVLSGGGTKGAYEASVAYHLIKHRGCDFKDFSGVSAGAVNVSFLAQAPMGSNSLENLQKQAAALIDIWKRITDPSAFMSSRFLGKLRMIVFGLEGLNDFSPLKEVIYKHIDTKKIQASGRSVRVGYTSFYDGGYREISPNSTCLHVDEKDQYLDYVFASALIPVFGDMPLIRQPDDTTDSTTWTQFMDGGVRHSTPVPGYFPNPDVRSIVSSGAVQAPCGVGELPPHPKPIQDLFVVVASPYDPLDDRIERLECNNQPCSQIHDGRDIAMRTISAALESPSRWDINYAITANNMLKWREALMSEIQDGINSSKMPKFPVASFNPGPRYDLSYRYMPIIRPTVPLTDGTYEVTKQTMLKQLWAGCQDANNAMVKLGATTMQETCEREFPNPIIAGTDSR